MSANSVTGTGPGASHKKTTEALAILVNGPSIIFAGRAEAADTLTSPPSTGNQVIFPYPLPGLSSEYVVIITTLNGGSAYVSSMINEEESDEFTGFNFITEAECDIMYIVTKVGIRPNI